MSTSADRFMWVNNDLSHLKDTNPIENTLLWTWADTKWILEWDDTINPFVSELLPNEYALEYPTIEWPFHYDIQMIDMDCDFRGDPGMNFEHDDFVLRVH